MSSCIIQNYGLCYPGISAGHFDTSRASVFFATVAVHWNNTQFVMKSFYVGGLFFYSLIWLQNNQLGDSSEEMGHWRIQG